MKLIKMLLLVALMELLCNLNIYGQQKLMSLKQGDHLPDVQLTFTNSNPIKTSDLKGKVILIHMWSTYCSVCIESFPLLDSLQKKYKDQLVVILVNTFEKKEGMNKNIEGLKIKMPRALSMVEDSTLIKLFPSVALGMHVYIDKQGKILAQNFEHPINVGKINGMIEGNKVEFANVPFVEPNKIYNSPFALAEVASILEAPPISYYSYITGYVGNNVERNNDAEIECTLQGDSINRILLLNKTILDLYGIAFDKGKPGGKFSRLRGFKPNNIVILDVNNPELYLTSPPTGQFEQWAKDNFYSYHLRLPNDQGERLFEVMKDDLKRAFGWEGKIEKRSVNCLVLSVNSKKKLTGSKKFTISEIVNFLQESPYVSQNPMPLISEIPKNLTFELPVEAENEIRFAYPSNKVREALDKYGFKLEEKQAITDVLVIREINKTKTK